MNTIDSLLIFNNHLFPLRIHSEMLPFSLFMFIMAGLFYFTPRWFDGFK